MIVILNLSKPLFCIILIEFETNVLNSFVGHIISILFQNKSQTNAICYYDSIKNTKQVTSLETGSIYTNEIYAALQTVVQTVVPHSEVCTQQSKSGESRALFASMLHVPVLAILVLLYFTHVSTCCVIL